MKIMIRIIKSIINIIKIVIGLSCIGYGIYLFFYTDINTLLINYNTQNYITEFQNLYGDVQDISETEEIEESNSETKETTNQVQKKEDKKKNSALYQKVLEYNQTIYQNEQVNFNENSLKESPIDSEELFDNKFGYIEIPALNKTFPLYLGASDKNMERGLAIMGQTSIPIGGKNTNSVIAGHRGWNTGNFLRDIEEVDIGDDIYITNPWEQLTYQVVKIDIVSPYASESLLIQEGKDMVTIMTCHPYASHGKYRYLVYCERTKNTNESNVKTKEKDSNNTNETIIASDGTVYESSNSDIEKEDKMRKVGGIIIIVFMIFIFFKKSYRKIRKIIS